jgi:hypothetical protein
MHSWMQWSDTQRSIPDRDVDAAGRTSHSASQVSPSFLILLHNVQS